MINFELAEIVRTLIASSIVYFPAVSIIGYGQAWAAKKVGDNTGQSLGYMTLNPAVHFDPLGFTMLFLFGYGWGASVPTNPYNIEGRWRSIKLVILFMSGSIFSFFQAIATFSLFIFMSGFYNNSFLAPFSSIPALFIAFKFIIERYVIFTTALTVVYAFWGLIRLLLFFAMRRDIRLYARVSEYLFLLSLLILALLFYSSYL